MNAVFNHVKKLAQSNPLANMRVGTVSSYDPSNYSVKVILQPEGAVTGWLPLVSAWIGNGWGMFSPPSVGDQIEVQYHDGDFDNGVACQRFFTDQNRPLSVPSGEFWLVHQSGSFIKLTNEGKVSISSGTEIDVGNLGSILHTLVTDAFISLFNGHTHPTGGGNTGSPNQTMGSSHMTSTLKAN